MPYVFNSQQNKKEQPTIVTSKVVCKTEYNNYIRKINS